MKNISILKTGRIIGIIAVALGLLNWFTWSMLKIGNKNVHITIMAICTVLFVVMLILIFGFSKKMEQEKKDEKNRKMQQN